MNNRTMFLHIWNKLHKIPFVMIFIVTLISFFGFFGIYSSSGGNFEPLVKKQILIFTLSLVLVLILSVIDFKIIFRTSYIIYFLILMLLIITNLLGKKFLGAKRWVNIFNMQVQPSELMKIALIMALARYFDSKAEFELKISHIIFPLLLVVVPGFLVLKQPDLGTAIIIFIFSTIIFFSLGIEKKYFIYFFICILISLPFVWSNLYPYQKDRVLVFLQPQKDILGKGYNIYQAKIAIGSGGILGKGFMQGTQSQLKFLPQNKTDFIFALIAEELGFIAVLVLISLYILLIWFMMHYVKNICSVYGKIIVIGVSSMIFAHVFVNIGVNIGIFPVTGVPLPFVSYGGTSIGSLMVGVGLVLNAQVNKNLFI